MREEIRHALLLAVSLVLLVIALTHAGVLVPALIASLITLTLSRPHFGYPYPPSYAKYDYIYRRYIVRALAVAYVLVALALYPSWVTLALALFVTTYAALSFYVGEHAAVTAFLLLVAAGGLALLAGFLSRPVTPLELMAAAFLAVLTVVAPLFFAAYYPVSKYYEMLYELGKLDRVKLPLSLGTSLTITILLVGFTIAGVAASIYLFPLYIIPTAIVGAGAAYAVWNSIRELRGELWSYLNYTEDLVSEVSDRLLSALAKTGWDYEVKPVLFRKGVRVRIKRPFKAEIVVREWVHRAYIPFRELRVPVKTGSGTIITVSPAPSKAPEELRRFMVSFLEELRLEKEASQWKA